MKNSADIRKENKKIIYQFMLDGHPHTKQQVSIGTGLSVATCNTLLNDMVTQNIISGSTKLPGEVGRSAILYEINDNHESYLAIHFYVVQKIKWIESIVFSATGNILSKVTQKYNKVDYEQVEAIIAGIVGEYSNLNQIIIGTPSIAKYGIIKHCDIPELENIPMKEKLESKFSLPVAIENDMHHKAYGYYKKTGNRNDVISLAYFPSYIFPGTATIHKGTIIRGANSFAGMTGFLPYNISKKEQLDLLKPETCIPFVVQSICAIIVLLNPSTIVLTGDLIDEIMLEKIIEKCRENIPLEYMPQFNIVDSFDEYYYEGMYQLAVDRKEF
ncbi:MAG: ROK family protein [Lachnospiraceae bacterium]|nr:ROK family protein [Lachnospiraceae bacterium]